MAYDDEFPYLKECGLYAAEIRGDGNCLFNALSDQIYGNQNYHSQIRSRVVEHVTSHEDYYTQFLEVYPGGGTRRNPKRKHASSFAIVSPSAEDVRRVFQEHVTRMARGGVWGDNMEIQAFTAAFEWSVKIYQHDVAYVIPAPNGEDKDRTAHIAYHTWEHYSSVRNIDGPHDGQPHIKLHVSDLSSQQAIQPQGGANSSFHVPPSQVKELAAACPDVDDATITRVLREVRGNSNAAYEKLMYTDEQRSVSSQHSSSIDREADCEDNNTSRSGSNKRQDRRMSRTSRVALTRKTQHRNQNIKSFFAKQRNDSFDDLVNLTTASHPPYRSKSGSGSNSDSDDWQPTALGDGSTSSDSEYTSPSRSLPTSASLTPAPTAPTIKIKLSLAKADSVRPAPKLSKHQASGRKGIAVRDKKGMKKAAQKQAARERKLAAATGRPPQQEETQAMATTAMKTLYI